MRALNRALTARRTAALASAAGASAAFSCLARPRGLSLVATSSSVPSQSRRTTCRAAGFGSGLSAHGCHGVSRRCCRTLAIDSGDAVETVTVLGIESSFDDTGVAVVRARRRGPGGAAAAGSWAGTGVVLGEGRLTQRGHATHAAAGGTVPRAAADLHKGNLPLALEQALAEAGVAVADVDAVACTVGPGLGPCLGAGLDFARRLCADHNKPLVPIHHMEAHALTPRMMHPLGFPYLVLLASGGHCLLLLCDGVGGFRRLGTTLDDAPGESFDKVARALGVDGGGAALEREAALAVPEDAAAARFSVPLAGTRSCDFSFSGLKSAALREIDRLCTAIDPGWAGGDDGGCGGGDDGGHQQHQQRVGGGSPAHARKTAEVMQRPEAAAARAGVAAAFQRAVCEHIGVRTHRALAYCARSDVALTGVVLSGGVACNGALRAELEGLADACGLDVYVPPIELCVDNGVMIAWNGVERLFSGEEGLRDADVDALRFTPKWVLGDDCSADVAAADIKTPKISSR